MNPAIFLPNESLNSTILIQPKPVQQPISEDDDDEEEHDPLNSTMLVQPADLPAGPLLEQDSTDSPTYPAPIPSPSMKVQLSRFKFPINPKTENISQDFDSIRSISVTTGNWDQPIFDRILIRLNPAKTTFPFSEFMTINHTTTLDKLGRRYDSDCEKDSLIKQYDDPILNSVYGYYIKYKNGTHVVAHRYHKDKVFTRCCVCV